MAAISFPDDSADLELLHGIASGDRAALASLYRAYHRRLCQFLTRLTRRAELIEEIINDCFWIVWQKAGSFREESKVSTWIMGIAYRCGLKALRQDGGLDTLSMTEEDMEVQHDLSSDPGEARELRNWLDKGMEKLSVDQRLVLELAYAGGHSLEEIAVITQSPVGTVKARMFHARLKLRNLLPLLANRSTAQ